MSWRSVTFRAPTAAIVAVLLLAQAATTAPAAVHRSRAGVATIAATAPVTDLLALPSERGEASLATSGRMRTPFPDLVPTRALTQPHAAAATLWMGPPRARSHVIHHRTALSDDPAPH